MTHYFIVPGLGNSGPAHWQTFFEQSLPGVSRIHQQEWDAPDCRDWITTINNAIHGYDPASVILIGHSLGCAAIVHWAKQYTTTIKGALLVAPSDPEAPQYTFPTTGFTPLPQEKLPFPSIVVASSNDEWISMEKATLFAHNWGSQLITIGEAGHINAASGFGNWQEGLTILDTLANQ
jgi:uncharacterized protein